MLYKQREDPFFKIQTPVLFAHRGGAREVPESTMAAFRHAVDNYADALELDVQLSKDREIVVWHGPKLDNVKIRGQSDSMIIRSLKGKRKIWQYNFHGELKDKAWVAHPEDEGEKKLYNIPEEELRKIISLEEFLDFLNDLDMEKKIPLNIELKGQKLPIIGKCMFLETDKNGEPYLLKRFKDILDTKGKGRKIIVASTSEKVLLAFDRINLGPSPFPTNVSVSEQLRYAKFMPFNYVRLLSFMARMLNIGKRSKGDLQNMAFETSYKLVTKKLVEKVRKENGAIYVFLTSFGLSKGIVDRFKKEKVLIDAITEILDTGVDGIMTDYPKKIGNIMREWRANPDN